MNNSLTIACRRQESAAYRAIVAAGANIDFASGLLLDYAIRDNSLPRLAFLIQEGISVRESHLDTLEQKKSVRNYGKDYRISSFLKLVFPIISDQSRTLAFLGEPTPKIVKNDAFQRDIDWQKQPLIASSVSAALIAAVLANFDPDKSNDYLKQLVSQDIKRVDNTKGLSYVRYLSAIKDQGLSFLEFGDVIKEVAEVIVLPVLVRAFYGNHEARLPDIYELNSLRIEALTRAADLIAEDKSTLDLLVLNAKWHRADNRCPDALRPYTLIAVWHPLFSEPVKIDDDFSMHCLATADELRDEGSAMSHCVGGYSSSCQSGKTQILSLRRRGTSVATIELAFSDRADLAFPKGSGWQVRQFKAAKNGNPGVAEHAAFARFKMLVQEGQVPENKLAGTVSRHNATLQKLDHIEQTLGFELGNSNSVRIDLLAHFDQRVVVERGGIKVPLISEGARRKLQEFIDSQPCQGDMNLRAEFDLIAKQTLQ